MIKLKRHHVTLGMIILSVASIFLVGMAGATAYLNQRFMVFIALSACGMFNVNQLRRLMRFYKNEKFIHDMNESKKEQRK